MDPSFHEALEQVLDLAKENPDRFVYWSLCSVDHLHGQICDVVQRRFDI